MLTSTVHVGEERFCQSSSDKKNCGKELNYKKKKKTIQRNKLIVAMAQVQAFHFAALFFHLSIETRKINNVISGY